MAFRPLPALTVATLFALALLVTLGTWQLRRAEEKRAMIARYEASASSPLLEPPLCVPVREREGRAVAPSAVDLRSGPEVRFFGAHADGSVGWRILRLVATPDCDCFGAPPGGCLWEGQLAVEIDFETLDGVRLGPPDALALTPAPRANAFTPQNDLQRGEYYRWDVATLSEAFGLPVVGVERDWVLFARAPGLPPGLAAMPPSRHIGYAITWYGIALALVGVYLAFHVRAGRLGRRI